MKGKGEKRHDARKSLASAELWGMNNVSGQQYVGGRKGIIYQVLVNCPFGVNPGGDMWVTIDPKKPLDKQTEGMLGYRMLTEEGEIIKQRFEQ